MQGRRPFRAVPIRMGKHYRRKVARQRQSQVAAVLGVGALAGITLGVASVAWQQGSLDRVVAVAQPLAVSAGIVRGRGPKPGDRWHSCSEARSAGSALIFVGEPGYQDSLDADSDGVACEPYRG